MAENGEFLKINDWEEHQSHRESHTWIRNYCSLLVQPKYYNLSAAQRGILHGLWLYRGMTGSNPPRDPEELRRTLRVPRDKHLSRTLDVLISRGFLKISAHQREREKEREIPEGKTAPRRARYPAPPLPSGKGFPDPNPMSPEDVRATVRMLMGQTPEKP